MKLCVSNIAWSRDEESSVAEILKKYDISALETAPRNITGECITLSSDELIVTYRDFWAKKGVSIVAVQAILYGYPQLTLFGSGQSREKTKEHIFNVIDKSKLLGVKRMVFGSPKNRTTNGLDRDAVKDIAVGFFSSIAEHAAANGMVFCIEPNPKEYGTDFVNTVSDAIKLVELVDHEAFRLHIDTGELIINDEDENILVEAKDYISHFHISRPNLDPVKDIDVIRHSHIRDVLKSIGYSGFVSIEMRRAGLDSLSSSIEAAKSAYFENG